MIQTKLKTPATRFIPSGFVALSRYPNDEIAMVITGEDGEQMAVATVALVDAKRAAPTHLWLKGWSENKGLPEALEEAGLVRLTGDRFPIGFVEAELAEILEPLWYLGAAFLRPADQCASCKKRRMPNDRYCEDCRWGTDTAFAIMGMRER